MEIKMHFAWSAIRVNKKMWVKNGHINISIHT